MTATCDCQSWTLLAIVWLDLTVLCSVDQICQPPERTAVDRLSGVSNSHTVSKQNHHVLTMVVITHISCSCVLRICHQHQALTVCVCHVHVCFRWVRQLGGPDAWNGACMIPGNPNCDKGLMDLNSPDYDFAREWMV